MKFVSFLELTNDPNELLELYSQSESLNVQAETELKLRKSERELIRQKLRKARNEQKDMQVSDHAVVRYLERVVGMDIDACKEEILSKIPATFDTADPVQFVKIPVGDLYYVIRDNLVISVTPLREQELASDKPSDR